MKQIKEILEIVREEFKSEEQLKYNNIKYLGLCHVVDELYVDKVLSLWERDVFNAYWNEYAEKRHNKVFYSFNNQKTDRFVGRWGWKHELKPPRLRWLDSEIKRLDELNK